MFALSDHQLHLSAESLPHDVGPEAARALLAGGAPCRIPIHGTIYCTLLNDSRTLAAMGDALNEPPYKAPPKAPVLYIKPRNTQLGHGAQVTVPDPQAGVEVGASVGIIIGRTAVRLSPEQALDYVAGYVAVADLCIPHESVYRPSVRFHARDGFCVAGPALIARRHVADPGALPIRVSVNGQQALEASTESCVRGVAQLLSDVTEFMTLYAGDVLTLGRPHGSPVVKAGDRIAVSIADWPTLEFEMVEKKGGQP